MKQEYIILRDSPSDDLSESMEGSPPLLPQLELRELAVSEIARVREEVDVVAITPNMPVELIEPAFGEELSLGMAQNEELTWGTEVMGTLETSMDGTGMVAAILDTGIDRSHPAFAGMKIVERDFSGDGNGDEHGHGTHCAGTIFGQALLDFRIGMAPGIERALIGKILDEDGKGETWDVLRGLNWAAENGANVVLLSLRLSFAEYVEQLIDLGYPVGVATPFALEAFHTTISFYQKYVAYLRLRSEALVIVAAGGNSNRRFENPAWDMSVEAPAHAGGIVSIGALAQGNDGLILAEFSNSGPAAMAPGVNIFSAKAGSTDLIAMTGTSMAASHAAGATLLWGQHLSEIEKLSSFRLEVKVLRSGDLSYIEPGYRRVDVGKGLLRTPMFDQEATLGRATLLQHGVAFYKTISLNTRDLLTFDLDPVNRRKRELMFLGRDEGPAEEGS